MPALIERFSGRAVSVFMAYLSARLNFLVPEPYRRRVLIGTMKVRCSWTADFIHAQPACTLISHVHSCIGIWGETGWVCA